MDARQFDAISRAVATGTSRRQLGRLLAGSALVGTGLAWVGTDATAGGRRCCRKQRRRYRQAKRVCESLGGQLVEEFSCDRATCDPDEQIAYLCEKSDP